jgi:hypothetical protein
MFANETRTRYNQRTEAVRLTPLPALTTTRKDRDMAEAALTPICSAHLGARAELIACSWLLGLGYEVFRNVSGAGPADLAIWHQSTGEHRLIDVKSQHIERTSATGGKQVIMRVPRHPDVLTLIVNSDVVTGFFKKLGNNLPVRYWPLDVPAPELPPGYNQDENLPRPNRYQIEWQGRTTSRAALARESGLSKTSFADRLQRGMTIEEAVTLPKPKRVYGDG